MSLVNDFSGLGIVMEEKEPGLRESLKVIHNDEFIKDISSDPVSSEAGSEMLLPPLPVEDELSIIAPIASACVSTTDLKPVSSYTSPFLAMEKTFEPINDELKIASDYSEILLNSCLSSTERNSPSLNLENALHVFPAMESPKTSKPELLATQNSDISSVNQPPAQPNTLPLKRLKSLKMGIRKLSLLNLSTNNSSSSINSPSTVIPAPPLSSTTASYPNLATSTTSTIFTTSGGTSKTILSPTDTLPLRHSQDSRNSDHLNSMNYEKQSAPSATSSNVTGGFSNGFSKRNRSRTLSGPALPATPNYSSPVITLSDNLQNSKKSLMNIEHSYFDNLHYSKSTSRSSMSNGSSRNEYSSGSGDELKEEDDSSRSISDISNPSELLLYLTFLKEQKKTIVNAFETTRKKLNESGWCSEHDLNNLQLQQDSSLCQLETKILLIKERLDTEFNLSLFKGNYELITKVGGERKASLSVEHEILLSPSLKTLENRCSTFTET